MKKLQVSTIFNGCFALSEKKIVKSLEIGAKLYGGATKIDNLIFSNFNESAEFDIFNENRVGLIVPGTIDVNSQIDNTKFVERVLDMLELAGKTNITNKNVEGAWIMENGNCVIENNNMILFDSKCDEFDMDLLKRLAEFIKTSMNQEAVSIVINDGLIIF